MIARTGEPLSSQYDTPMTKGRTILLLRAGLVNCRRPWACDCLPKGVPDGSRRALRRREIRATSPSRTAVGVRCHATAVAGLDNSRALLLRVGDQQQGVDLLSPVA